MRQAQLGLRPEDFIWASGIEDTFVPQTRPGQRALDEYELIGHYQHWRADLALGRELGIQAIRWGVPWYRIEPRPGEFDWRLTDAVIPYIVEDLGITPIIDLMHYGCPFWLEREFDNPAYPQLVAAYAAAFAERYRSLVRWYTPLNEPVMNAWMCGQRGVWPPYLQGDRGYIRLMLQLADGIEQTVEAVQAIDPGAIMVHVDVAGQYHAAGVEQSSLAAHFTLRGLLCYDLIAGQVGPVHPLYAWLIANGASEQTLATLRQRAILLDIVGLNFYPQWSTKQVGVNQRGRRSYRPVDKDGTGFAALVESYYRRYGAPIMITETSARGSIRVRSDWLRSSVAAINVLRGQGVPVVGYTWFPMVTMINWSYRYGARPWNQYRLELGLYTLDTDNLAQRWRGTPLVDQFRRYVADPASAIGSMPSVDYAATSLAPVEVPSSARTDRA